MHLSEAGAMDADQIQCFIGRVPMSTRQISTVIVLGFALLTLGGCGNTIRGVGRDVGNAVEATKDAGHSVAQSVK